MILGCGSAPGLPDRWPNVRVTAAVAAVRVVEVRRDPAATTPAHRAAAPRRGPTQAELVRPGPHCAAARRHSQTPPWRPASDCHAADRLALAPRHPRSSLGRQVPPQTPRAPACAPQHHRLGAAPGQGQPQLGLPAHPRRTRRARHRHGAVDGVGDLTKAGIPPAPRRAGPTWAQFLHAQAQAIIATDFFTVNLLDATSAYVLAVIEHATRRIRILGVTAHPNDAWVTQMARNLLMDLDEHVESIKFLLRDRDTKFTAAFDTVFTSTGIRILRSPIRAPRANAIMERWIGSCRRELLDQTLIWNQQHLLRVLREYETHHNSHRPHRSLDQAAPLKPLPAAVADLDTVRIHRRNRVGGVIHEYTLAA